MPLALLPLASHSEHLNLWESSRVLCQAKVSSDCQEGWKRHRALPELSPSHSHALALPTPAGAARLELDMAPVGFQTCWSLPGVLGVSLCAQWGQSTASLLAFLSGMMTPLFQRWRASAPAPGCPGGVTVTGQGTATSTGTPSLFQLPASACSF